MPIELPEGVDEAEEVTDAIVDATGLITEDTAQFDRWVYFATPDEPSGNTYLSILVREDNLAPQQAMRPVFYLPAAVISTTQATPIPLRPTPGEPQPTATPAPLLALTPGARLVGCVSAPVSSGFAPWPGPAPSRAHL